ARVVGRRARALRGRPRGARRRRRRRRGRERLGRRARADRHARARLAVRRRAGRCRTARGRLPRAGQPAGAGRDVIRVLLAHHQALVRSGFRMILEARDDVEVVGEAEDGDQAVALVRSLQPDAVLMDVRMPRLDGIEATRRIVASGAETRVLILTTYDLDEYVYAAIRAGASAFLLKDVEPEQLVDAVRV